MTIDPTIFAATILGTVFATLLGHRMLDYARSRDGKVALQVENVSLKKEVANLQSQNLELQRQKCVLEEQIAANYGRETIHLRFPLDKATGLRTKDGHLFCSVCFPDKFTEIVPSKTDWHCRKCDTVHRFAESTSW